MIHHDRLPGRSGSIVVCTILGLLFCLESTFSFADTPADPPDYFPLDSAAVEQPVITVRFLSIESGGGSSSDGVFSIRGTVGQPLSGESVTCRQKSMNDLWSVATEIDLDLIYRNGFEFDAACE